MNLQSLMDIIQTPPFLLTSVMILCGIGALMNGFRLRDHGQPINWEVTDGELIECELVSKTIKYNSLYHEEHYWISIRYVYTVNGRSYVGENFQVDQRYRPVHDYNMGKNLIKAFEAHPNFVVYYNPRHPSDCTLEKGQRRRYNYSIRNYQIGISLLVIALVMFLLMTAMSNPSFPNFYSDMAQNDERLLPVPQTLPTALYNGR